TVIKVPKTPKSAYNPNRPAGLLLQAQIVHLEHALGMPERKPKRRTEGEAARYIATLTARLMSMPPASKPAQSASPPPSQATPPPKSARARKKRPASTRRRTAKRRTRKTR